MNSKRNSGRLSDSIDYIEDNIRCDISAGELSERAGFSVFHYYRVSYVILSNQLIVLAWFEGKEKYQEIHETNKKMTEWLVSVWSE